MNKSLYYHITFLGLLIAFLLYKSFHLNVPFFWDESWVYGPAVQLMADNGPGLLPDSLNDWYSRGHPLMFHFLAGTWINLFGNSLIAIHLFPLFISVLLLLTLYVAGGRLGGWQMGLFASLLMLIQASFLAQSAMVLPEILLAFFTLLTLISYVKGNYLLAGITGTFAVLTKETGIIIVSSILLYDFISKLLQKEKFFSRKNITGLVWLCVPFLVMAGFLLIQYFQKGWFFYPQHLKLVETGMDSILNKLGIFYQVLFIKNGMIAITLVFLASAIFVFIDKQKIESNLLRFSWIGLIYLVFFSLFSSLNFFTNRYLLPVFPIYFVIVAWFLTASSRPSWQKLILVTVISLFSLSFSFLPQHKRIGDTSSGYLDGMKVHQECIDFLVNQNIQDEGIMSHFLMVTQLKNPLCRYLEKEERFTDVGASWNEEVKWIVYSNFERNFDIDQLKKERTIELIKRFESGKAYTEIYKVIP